MDADKFSQFLDGDRVDIYVGPSRQHWNLPEKLLCHHSPFFEKAFTGSFKEGFKKRIEFKENDVATFKLLVYWMFTNTIDKPKPDHGGGYFPRPPMIPASPEVEAGALKEEEEDSIDSEIDKAGNDEAENTSAANNSLSLWKRFQLGMWIYSRLYVLADKLGMVDLQDQALEVLRDGTVHFSDPQIVLWIYQNTLPCSPLRRCAASMASSALLLKYLVPTYFDIAVASCDDFAKDLVQALVREGKEVIYSKLPFRDQSCVLHKHRDGEACPRVEQTVVDERDYWNASRRSRLEGIFLRRWLDIVGICRRDRGICTPSQLRSTILKEVAKFIDEIDDPPAKRGVEKWKPVPYVPTAVFNTPLPGSRTLRRNRPVKGHG